MAGRERATRGRRWLVGFLALLFLVNPALMYLATFHGWPFEFVLMGTVATLVTFVAWISGGILK